MSKIFEFSILDDAPLPFARYEFEQALVEEAQQKGITDKGEIADYIRSRGLLVNSIAIMQITEDLYFEYLLRFGK